MNAVLTDLPAWFDRLDGTEGAMVITALWCRSEPWAVELTIPSGHGDVVWLVGRDLLYDGLTGSVGEGDVRVFPSGHWGRTLLRLSSPAGRAEISLDEEELREFLVDTFDVVPEGEELLWIPLDQELTELLDGSEL